MVTTIDGIQAVRPVCLYSSGIFYAIVKCVLHQISCGRHGLPELCKSFLALPESGSSRLLLLYFRGSFARLISVSSVRPATLSHWSTNASVYAQMVYIQAGASLRPPVFSRSGKSLCLPRIPGFGCLELLRPRTRCYN